MAPDGVAELGKRRHAATLRARLRTADPMWVTRWLVLLVLLLGSLPYGTLQGEAPPPVVVGIAVIAVAVVVNLVLRAAQYRAARVSEQARVARWAFLVDVVLVSAFVALYAFAPTSGHHLLLFLLVVEGATVFGLTGALLTWVYGAVLWTVTWQYSEIVLGVTLAPDRVLYPVIATAVVAVATGLLAERVRGQQRLLAEAVDARDRELAWRRALIDMLAHDLRSPMATAATSAELLASRSEELSREQVTAFSDAARRQIRRALRLLDDLLDLGRARAGALELHSEAVPLDAFVAETLEELPARFAEEVELELSAGPAVVAAADRARLAQVLWNLVTNAHKHGSPPITVRLGSAGEDTVELEVADHGPGVAPEVLERMFEPFSSGGEDGSTGLGLWISQLLVGAMGGVLRHEGADGLTRFVVRLPAATAAGSPTSTAAGTPTATRTGRTTVIATSMSAVTGDGSGEVGQAPG